MPEPEHRPSMGVVIDMLGSWGNQPDQRTTTQ
jgi:hypothetical protein